MRLFSKAIILTVNLLFFGLSVYTCQAGEAEDLAALAQNPVSNAIILPLQNNTVLNIGPQWSTHLQFQFLFPTN